MAFKSFVFFTILIIVSIIFTVDSLPKAAEEVSNTCNNVLYNRSTHFGNRYRKFRHGNLLTKRSCLTTSPNIQLSESDRISNVSTNKQNEVPTGTQEIVAVKTQVRCEEI